MKVALALAAPPKNLMRVPTTLLLFGSLIVLGPAALAKTNRAPAKPVHAAPLHTVASPARSHGKAAPVKASTRTPEPHRKPSVESRVSRLELPVKPLASGVRAQPALPEPHVLHDRKIHHEADPVPPVNSAEVRKATSADFLSAGVSHPPTDDDAAPLVGSVPPPSRTAAAPVAKPVSMHLSEEITVAPVIVPALYNASGKLLMPPPLKGSHEILVRQNETAEQEGLDRIHDDAELLRMRRAKLLVAIPASRELQIDERLAVDRRYCRPWVARFLADMARAHYARFGTALQVNSAVRTVEFQVRLMRINGNAAAADGDAASPHLTGQAVDLAKKDLTPVQVAWMRGYLAALIQQGKIDVEEEFQQSCFHISVYRSYLPAAHAPAQKTASLQTEMHTAALSAASLKGSVHSMAAVAVSAH